jgi:nucleoid-associated protein YgaU
MGEYEKTRAGFGSRYRFSSVRLDDFVAPGRRRYTLWKSPEIDLEGADTFVVTDTEVNRVDLIAWKFYGDCSLWWVICYANNIKNAFEELKVGTVLKIPQYMKIVESTAFVTE